MDQIISFNIILLGKSCAKKIQLIRRYVYNDIRKDNYISKIGYDMSEKMIKINDINIILKIADTIGQEKHRSLSSLLSKNCDGVIFVYDITNDDSFNDLYSWIRQLNRDYGNISKF